MAVCFWKIPCTADVLNRGTSSISSIRSKHLAMTPRLRKMPSCAKTFIHCYFFHKHTMCMWRMNRLLVLEESVLLKIPQTHDCSIYMIPSLHIRLLSIIAPIAVVLFCLPSKKCQNSATEPAQATVSNRVPSLTRWHKCHWLTIRFWQRTEL